MSLWAITTLFNLTPGRVANYLRFAANMKQCEIPLMTVSISDPMYPYPSLANFDIPKDMRGDIEVIQMGGNMWQKERMINTSLDFLPRDCDKVMAIDSDIIWPNHSKMEWGHYAEMMTNRLDDYDVVQGFKWLEYLNADGNGVHKVIDGIAGAFAYQDTKEILQRYREPNGPVSGGIWGYRKEWLRAKPLYENCIVGGGDAACAWAYADIPEHFVTKLMDNRPWINDYWRWYDRLGESNYKNIRMGFIPTTVQHLYHGELSSRNYNGRNALILGYDPATDIVADGKLPLRWTKEAFKKELPQKVHQYFLSRGDL